MRIPTLPSGRSLFGETEARTLSISGQSMGTPTAKFLRHETLKELAPRSSSTCEPGNNTPICQKPVSADTETLPIVLGAVIPICCALVVFFFLHRRHLKKQKIEDENDKHKSLDFGMGNVSRSKHNVPEMTVTDLGPSHPPGVGHRGQLSMDMMTPYLLPNSLHDSRESLHSLSRSLHDEHDPYRPVAALRDMNDPSKHRFADNGSIYSMSTGKLSSHEKANLVSNAQRMSQSIPKVHTQQDSNNTVPNDPKMSTPIDSKMNTPHDSKTPSDEFVFTPTSLVQERELPPPPPPPQVPSIDVEEPVAEIVPPPRTSSSATPGALRPVRKESIHHNRSTLRESSNYGDAEPPSIPSMPEIPIVNEPPPDDVYDIDPSLIEPGGHDAENNHLSHAEAPNMQRYSIMGMRPLPPDNLLVDDNPEQRANRIRSFYKEYFDDSKPEPDGVYGGEHEDYYDGAVFDEETGQFIMASRPFAQAPGRRAMTPPPRGAGGAPRFSGGQQPHRRQFSSMSHARGRPPMAKKKLPPPRPLQGLPNPAKLDLESALANSIDFAPPSSFRDVQNGRRPDSPAGIRRAYSPSVRAFTPLASAYDDLAVMPSPHLLRKSGTFTALDFAPPRIRAQEVGSDAGSIRSARSGISAMQMDAVRAGAYRVSRIPREMVTTREDFTSQLRPKLSMVNPA